MIISYNLKSGLLDIIESNSANETRDEYCDYSGLIDDYTDKALGLWTKLKYDKHNKELLVEQHMYGTPNPIYIAEKDNVVFISESLLRLKCLMKVQYELNVDILPHFFYNGFLAGQHTLVRGVYKLSLGKRLRIKNGQAQLEDINILQSIIKDNNDINGKNYNEIYDFVLGEAIESSLVFLKNERKCVALSTGYDSNYILYQIKKILQEQNVEVYSVGGYNGADETLNAQIIAEKYDNILFNKSLVTPKTLDYFDDIVLRLEGSVYERGIFLQYELAKLLKEHNCRFLLCGEAADQVFNKNTYNNTLENRFLYDYYNTPLEMAYYVVMRKSVSLLWSFGIRGIYPFINSNVIKMGFLTRELNGVEKTFHKQRCMEKLPQEVSSMIIKQGGSTSLSALFEENENIAGLLHKNKFYDPNYRLTQKYSEEEAMMDYYLTLSYVESFERQFCDNG